MPQRQMLHEIDPREVLYADLGDLSDVEVFNNHVLVAIYKRPEKTKSGIILTATTRDEDRYQSKVGLVIKLGASAFEKDAGTWFKGIHIMLGDWLVFRPSDGWSIGVNEVDCRIVEDIHIMGRVRFPDQVW